MKYAIVFPGQGSQSLGMLSDLSSNFSIVKDIFSEASDALDLDLWKLVQEDEDALNLTKNTQPAMLAAGYATYKVLSNEVDLSPVCMAGHSLGEYTALVAAKSLNYFEAVKLVRKRAELMQLAVPSGTGAMAVILGLDDEKVIEIDAEEEAIIAEEESKETVAEEVEIYFQGSNESTENIVKVREKERQEYSPVSAPVKEKSFQSYNAFTEFFKQTEALKTQPEDVPANPSTPAEEAVFTGDVATVPKFEELIEENFIDDSAAKRDGEAKEANDEFEIMSNEPNQDEINVISALEDVPTLNIDAQMLVEESVDNKADEPTESTAEATNQSEVMSTKAVKDQEEIFSTQSMPMPEKAKNQVVVIQSFKKHLSGGSSTDDGVNASDIETNIDAENKTKPKVRPSIKELKNDLILLSKLIKAAPRREKKNSDQKQSQF